MAGLIRKGRISIIQGEGFVKITWQRLHWLHIVGMFGLPISMIIIMSGEMGLKEIMGHQTIQLTTNGHIVFWAIWLGLFYLIVFNRKSSLIANKDEIVLRNGLFPNFLQKVEMNKVIEITIKEKKELPLAENDYAGPNRGPFYRVIITRDGSKPIRTDDFIREEAERICEEIKRYR